MFNRILDQLDRAVCWVVVAVAAAMTSVVCAQVVLRYGFEGSFDWAEETARLCFVWLIFLAMPLAVKRGVHVSVELFTNLLPRIARDVLLRITSLLSAILMVFVVYFSLIVLRQTWYEMLLTIDISVGWFTVPILIGTLHSALHLIGRAIYGMPDKRIEVMEELE